MSTFLMVPGATAVGIAFKDGVVLGADKRFSYGSFLMSRSIKKVFKISESAGAACAGMISDMQVIMREISTYVRLREMETKRRVPPNSIAKLLSILLYREKLFPLLTEIVVGGVDGESMIYVLDPLGSVIPDKYVAVGSGAETAIGILENEYREGMSEAEAVELVIKSIKAAALRNISSGDGADMLIIKESGVEERTLRF